MTISKIFIYKNVLKKINIKVNFFASKLQIIKPNSGSGSGSAFIFQTLDPDPHQHEMDVDCGSETLRCSNTWVSFPGSRTSAWRSVYPSRKRRRYGM